jgi:5-(carboxyamino)imidazole ribonucleotide synthase
MKLGILGGGQLGRMMMPHAHRLGIHVTVLDAPDAVCGGIAHRHIHGNFRKAEDVEKLSDCDVVTVEIEDVSLEGLAKLEALGVRIVPSIKALTTIQDKGTQKDFFSNYQIPTAPYELRNLSGVESLDRPAVLKLRRGGYDGRGVIVLRAGEKIPQLFQTQVVVEECIEIATELAVLVANNGEGETRVYTPIEMVFDPKLNLIDSTFIPGRFKEAIAGRATEIALKIAKELSFQGLLAVEMFLTKAGDLLVNELAPRPHNSGHGTIEACYTDQFEQFLRAVLSLPLGEVAVRASAMTLNLLGEEGFEGETQIEGLEKTLSLSQTYLHLYGKVNCRPGRKMGHVTILGDFNHTMEMKKKVQTWLKLKGKKPLS